MEKKFRLISIIFLSFCVIFYGVRFGYYYMKFNKKPSTGKSGETLSLAIQKKGVVSKGDGIYSNSGELVYKGKKVDNYVLYSNILWRIVKVNNDNSVELVTDSTISNLMFDQSSSELTKSNIHDYLDKVLLNKLNDPNKYLVNNTICKDKLVDTNNMTCNVKDSSKVSLLSLADYINSKSEDSYLNNTNSFWVYNPKDDLDVWYINEGNLSNDKISSIHGVKAVITLKNSIGYLSGNGTKEKPYVIDKNNKVSFNDYVKLGDDLYQIYDIDDNYRLVNTKLVQDVRNRSTTYYDYKFDPKTSYSLALYLNNYYLNELSYKNLLVDCDYNVGDYKTDYNDVYSEKIKTKVGLLSIADINTNNELKNYFLLNRYNGIVMSKDSEYTSNQFRNTVCISKTTKLNGNGTLESPYIVEE